MRDMKHEIKNLIDEYNDDVKAGEYRAELRYQRNRIASDGKRYDEDNLNRELYENEVEIIQFLRPNGRRRFMTCEVTLEIKEMAKDMILSAEELNTGRVAIYSRFKGESEENERLVIAINSGDPVNGTTAKLIEAIKIKYSERSGE